jgi:hypothetical protein
VGGGTSADGIAGGMITGENSGTGNCGVSTNRGLLGSEKLRSGMRSEMVGAPLEGTRIRSMDLSLPDRFGFLKGKMLLQKMELSEMTSQHACGSQKCHPL